MQRRVCCALAKRTGKLHPGLWAGAGIQKGFSMDKQFCVYILASGKNGTLYIGVTSELAQRVWQHKNKQVDGFTRQYEVDRLVYWEVHESAESAIRREKQIKKWNRRWKLRIIEEANPTWRDLYADIV